MYARVRDYVQWWAGEPSDARIEEIGAYVPKLTEFVDLSIVRARLSMLSRMPRDSFGVRLSSFFPELGTLLEATGKAVESVQASPHERAEAWLRPIAQTASDADLEAAVYLVSRGHKDAVDATEIERRWHRDVCYQVETRHPQGRRPDDITRRAKERTLSLKQAADLLRFNDELGRFWGFRDEEEDFIDSTMVRTVEWLGIGGFDEWWKSALRDFATGPQYGIDQAEAAWWLFHWCRSDLALRMAGRQGPEAWLWAMLNGVHERQQPWRLSWPHDRKRRVRDYLPIAASIAFVWQRIKPEGFSDEVLNHAVGVVTQSQLGSGGWPIWSDDAEPSILATSLAIHALALNRPSGWSGIAQRGAKWLLSKQHAFGYWDIPHGPTVMLTVLALDAIDLASGSSRVTFHVAGSSSDHESEESIPDPEFDYKGMPWVDPNPPSTRAVSLKSLSSYRHVDVLLMTATDVELRQVLRLLKPPRGQRHLPKVTHESETYYLGRFGAFRAAVFKSTMGSTGPAAAPLAANSAIKLWRPRAIIMAGIAFAASRKKHQPADIFLAEQIIPYDVQRVGEEVVFRAPIPPTSSVLRNRFENALDWKFTRPDGERVRVHQGPLLSGDKLIDDPKFKHWLLKQFPSAIGGEMEGAGVWAAAARDRVDWILAKAVVDWGDGKKHKQYQQMGAAAAASICHHVLSQMNAFEGL